MALQIAVKVKRDLWVTRPEQMAMARVLDRCPAQQMSPDSGSPVVVDHNLRDPGPADSGPHPSGSGAAGRTPYANCDQARAAAAAPVLAGDPGYGDHLDGDGDGVACE